MRHVKEKIKFWDNGNLQYIAEPVWDEDGAETKRHSSCEDETCASSEGYS